MMYYKERDNTIAIENYSKLFASKGGLGDFVIYDADVQLRNLLNEKYRNEVKKSWNRRLTR